jgi:alpha-tubulin suppressor-like RCC1 family protein
MQVEVSNLSSGVVAIAAGDDHTCAITIGGGVKCWGRNIFGELGNGSTDNTSIPVEVSGLSSGIAAIAAGSAHTCALTTGGGVKCWGYNYYGQLGDGTTVYTKTTPVQVSGLSSGVTAIAAGSAHTCALTTGGGVKCWGTNDNGQLGDGTTDNQNTPVDVSGLSSGVAALTAGSDRYTLYHTHTCAVTTSGGVKCWGYNNNGQLGDGTTDDNHTPVDVRSLSSGVTGAAAGEAHTCVLTIRGGVRCWGYNAYGQLGDSTNTSKRTPVEVNGLSTGVAAISTGGFHTCALTTTGGVKCWGSNRDGQLGDGNAWRTTPVDVVEAALATPTSTVTPTPNPVATSTPTPTAEPTVVTARVEGKVLDQTTQNGIPDVLMTLTDANGQAAAVSSSLVGATVYTTTTRADGAFVFPAVKLGTYTLSGAKAGVVIQSPAPLVISNSATVPVAPLQATKANAMIYLPLVTKR